MSLFTQNRFDKNPRLEAQAFFDGAHELDPKQGVSQIDARFNQEAAKLQGESVTQQKKLEAEIKHLEEIQPESHAEYEALKTRFGHEPPQMVVPTLIAVAGAAALIGEAIMLAPSLDALSITNPVAQLLAAFSLAAFTAAIFHLALETLTTSRWSRLLQIIWRVLGIWGVVSMICWGVMRGFQVAFAADIAENPLGQFLHGHPILAAIFYVFVTLGAPLAAAGAITYSATHIRDAVHFRRAKQRALYISRQLPRLTKALEAEREGLKQNLKQIEEKNREWKQAYLLFHERGNKRSALQSPFWTVVLKAAIGALLSLILVGFLALHYPPLFLLPLAVFIAAFVYFRHQWNHPTPAQFFAHEHVNFGNTAGKGAQK